jgi:formate-dependent nitrite reductase membrane component NrfD
MDHIHWNYIVAVDLFAAGLSAGAFIIAATAYFIGGKKYEPITQIGAYIAPFPVILGILALIYDLERPHLFWTLFLHFEPNSVMSWGSWLLLFFSLISFAYLYLWLPEKYDYLNLRGRIRRSPFLTKLAGEDMTVIKGLVGGMGIPIAIGVAIYTGVLLGALTARPFWNNPMLPMIFLLSAMLTGTASICFVGCFLKGKVVSHEEINTQKFLIHSFDFTLIVFSMIGISLFILGLYVSPRSSAEAVKIIMGGFFTYPFWILVVGIGLVVPFLLEVYELMPHYITRDEMREHRPLISGLISMCILVGAFTMRYIVIYSGQLTEAITH